MLSAKSSGAGCHVNWCFADDLAVVSDTEEEMQRRWLGWQIGMESKGLKVNTGEAGVMVSSRRNKSKH